MHNESIGEARGLLSTSMCCNCDGPLVLLSEERQKRVLISKKKSRPGKSHKPLKAKTVAAKHSNPIPEQANTVDHALDQEEMEKEPVLQSALLNESHQKEPSMTFSPYFSW